MKNNDFDYIKNKFDNDGVDAPDSIDVNRLIGDKSQLKVKTSKNIIKPLLSAVACLVILATTTYVASPVGQSQSPKSQLQTFNNYSEIEKRVTAQQNQIKLFDNNAAKYTAMGEADIAVAENASIANNQHGTTNIQEEGVDEADIIKNDGKYIYYATYSKVLIYKGTKQIAKINADKSENINDMYLDGNSIILITSKVVEEESASAETEDNEDDVMVDLCYVPNTDTMIKVYDITDITDPKLKNTFSQSGSYSTSRKIGNRLYILSTKFITNANDCVIYYENEGEKKEVSPKDIAYTDSSVNSNYSVVSGYDLSKGTQIGKTKAIMGYSGEIYCSKDNMYIVSSDYEKYLCHIAKIELKSNSVAISKTGSVKGVVNNQFSMDEEDDVFRIATTTKKNNYIYTLDENLEQIGVTDPFGKEESIQATYYIGDYAYAITYKETDPLFVINLKDPSNPIIKGEVKISGFSTQLVPVDDGVMMGIGYSDSDDVKIALFDISDPEKPWVIDSKVLENCASNAQNNHKAILINKEKNYYAIDYYRYDATVPETGAVTIKADKSGINITNKYMIETDPTYDSYASRCTYISDKLYVLDENGKITEFTVK
ncbi:MAG: beta-propeller domain-containing protein [Eubacterium sp.]